MDESKGPKAKKAKTAEPEPPKSITSVFEESCPTKIIPPPYMMINFMSDVYGEPYVVHTGYLSDQQLFDSSSSFFLPLIP